MADYTYQELMEMQNDAIRRVEDMQKRARQTAGLTEDYEEKAEENSESRENQGNRESRNIISEPKRVPMPSGYLRNSQSSENGNIAEATNNFQREDSTGNSSNPDFFEKIKSTIKDLNVDKDKALLLGLILLLSEEKADELLITALIYMLT